MQLPKEISWSGCPLSLNPTPQPTLHEKCLNTEFFQVRIFLYLDWIQRFTVQTQETTDQKKLRIWTLFMQCYGSQNVSSKRVTRWDNGGDSRTLDVNLWHYRWRRLQKTYIGSSSSNIPMIYSQNIRKSSLWNSGKYSHIMF